MVSEGRVAVALTVSSTESSGTQSGRLRAVDLLLLAYLTIVSIVAVVRASSRPGWWLVLVAHGLFVLLLFLLTRPNLGRVGRTLREIYPLLLLLGLYSELDVLNSGGGAVHDQIVQRWELLLFGTQISREWWQTAPSRFWSTVLHAAYLSYYFIVAAPALYFAWRGDLAAVRRFVLVVMATFIVCYLVFLFFPVAGPYYQFPRPARLVYRQSASPPRVPGTGEWQLVRRGVPVLPCRGSPGGHPGRVASLVAARFDSGGADGSPHRGRRVLPDALRSRCARGASGRGIGDVGGWKKQRERGEKRKR